MRQGYCSSHSGAYQQPATHHPGFIFPDNPCQHSGFWQRFGPVSCVLGLFWSRRLPAAVRTSRTTGRTHCMEEHILLEGRITTVLAGTMFRVELDNKHVVLAHISGKMRKRFIRLTPGDRVKIEMSPYDLNKARITYRLG